MKKILIRRFSMAIILKEYKEYDLKRKFTK